MSTVVGLLTEEQFDVVGDDHSLISVSACNDRSRADSLTKATKMTVSSAPHAESFMALEMSRMAMKATVTTVTASLIQ